MEPWRRSSAEIDRIVELFSRIATLAGGQDRYVTQGQKATARRSPNFMQRDTSK